MVDEINFLPLQEGLNCWRGKGAKERLQHLLHWQGCGCLLVKVQGGVCAGLVEVAFNNCGISSQPYQAIKSVLLLK